MAPLRERGGPLCTELSGRAISASSPSVRRTRCVYTGRFRTLDREDAVANGGKNSPTERRANVVHRRRMYAHPQTIVRLALASVSVRIANRTERSARGGAIGCAGADCPAAHYTFTKVADSIENGFDPN